MADPMKLIKQQIFSTNKINSFCVTTCCQIIIVPLQASSLFNWSEILAMPNSFTSAYEKGQFITVNIIVLLIL